MALSLRPHFGEEASILCAWDGGLDLPESLVASDCTSLLLPSGLLFFFLHQFSRQNPQMLEFQKLSFFFFPEASSGSEGSTSTAGTTNIPTCSRANGSSWWAWATQEWTLQWRPLVWLQRCHHPATPGLWGEGCWGQQLRCTNSLSELEYFGQKPTWRVSWFSSCLLFHLHHQQP